LAHQNVAGVDFSTDVNDACLIQLGQCALTDVRDVGGDVLWAELGIARDTGQLLDVNRGEPVFTNDALRDQDRIFEVVAIPRHERDAHVLTERQLTEVGGGAIGEDIALGHRVAGLHERALVDTGVLVRTRVLDHVVDVDGRLARQHLSLMDTHHDASRVNHVDHAAAARNHADTGIARHCALHAGTYERLLRYQRRYRLTLHVRAHQCTVRVIVLEERDQRSGDRYHLLRRYVHVLDFVRQLDGELVQIAHRDQIVGQLAFRINRGRRLRDYVLCLVDRRQELDMVGDLAIDDLAVRAFDKTVIVGARECGQRVDQTDVRAFRRFDRAHAAIMRRVNVAHFEAGTLTGEAAWAERRDATLVGDFRQRVVLVHELRQLTRTEELLHRRRNRLGVDQILRHQAFAFSHRQTVFDCALYTHKADAKLVFRHLAD